MTAPGTTQPQFGMQQPRVRRSKFGGNQGFNFGQFTGQQPQQQSFQQQQQQWRRQQQQQPFHPPVRRGATAGGVTPPPPQAPQGHSTTHLTRHCCQ